jgi:putative transposase
MAESVFRERSCDLYHRTIKSTCIPVRTPLSLYDARSIVADFVHHYNTRRLHSAIGYITPKNTLDGRAETILAERDAKLAAGRDARKAKRRAS